jgi:hypothetical protein
MIEKLEKEAEEWLDERYLKDMGVRKPCKQAYFAGAEPREKQIEKLKQQIKQMKYDVIECFGSEYDILVAKLLKKWEIKE